MTEGHTKVDERKIYENQTNWKKGLPVFQDQNFVPECHKHDNIDPIISDSEKNTNFEIQNNEIFAENGTFVI